MNSHSINGATINSESWDIRIKALIICVTRAFLIATGRVWRRESLGVNADATTTVIKPRSKLRRVIKQIAEASLSLLSSTGSREYWSSAEKVIAQATTTLLIKIRVRSVVSQRAEAFIVPLKATIYRQLPYDEPAIAAHTFIIAYEPNVFYVVS